jgi:hypothetical protein
MKELVSYQKESNKSHSDHSITGNVEDNESDSGISEVTRKSKRMKTSISDPEYEYSQSSAKHTSKKISSAQKGCQLQQ